MTPETIAHNYNLHRVGNGYAGPCPKCGGSPRSDKFNLKDDGGFKCYACGFKGDAITWLREIEGKTCPEAFEALGQPCDRHDCAVRGTCRMGRGEGKPAQRTPQSVSVPPDKNERRRITEQRDPARIWLDWAEQLVDKAAATITNDLAAPFYLQQRGITSLLGPGYRLGSLAHMAKVDRASIGLPAERNGKNTLWVPSGIVIATLDDHGAVHRIRIRRTDADRQKFRADLKYVWIEGSGNAPLLIRREQAKGTVIVEAELDAIAIACAHDQVNVIALGTVDMPPTAVQAQLLEAAPVILVALDADAETAAGQKAVKGWLSAYPQAKYWPVPAPAKDPGEYAQQGKNLHTWINAGLPTRPAVAAVSSKPQDDRTIPLTDVAGGGGTAEKQDTLPAHTKGQSLSGHHYVIAHQAQHVDALRKHYGCAVFTAAEVKLLQGYTKAEAEQVLLAKHIFDNGQVIDSCPADVPPPVDPPPRAEPYQESLL